MQDVILASHPSEPHTQRHKPRVLRTEAQRLAIGLAVVEQVPLIAFQHWPRDFQRLRDAALFQPVDKELDVTGAAPHGVFRVVPHFEIFQVVAHQGFKRRLGLGGRFALLYAGHHWPAFLWPLLRCSAATTAFSSVSSPTVFFGSFS